jgi:hypothetical protein
MQVTAPSATPRKGGYFSNGRTKGYSEPALNLFKTKS